MIKLISKLFKRRERNACENKPPHIQLDELFGLWAGLSYTWRAGYRSDGLEVFAIMDEDGGNKQYGACNEYGRVVILPRFDKLSDFKDGFADAVYNGKKCKVTTMDEIID